MIYFQNKTLCFNLSIAKAGFVDGSTRDELLIMEDQIKELLANNQLYEAYVVNERRQTEDFINCCISS